MNVCDEFRNKVKFIYIKVCKERRCGEVVTSPPTVQAVPGSIPGQSGRLSEFRCDLIKRSDNT